MKNPARMAGSLLFLSYSCIIWTSDNIAGRVIGMFKGKTAYLCALLAAVVCLLCVGLAEGVTVGAVAAVNAVGDVYHPVTGEILACAHTEDGARVPAEGLLMGQAAAQQMLRIPAPGTNTTISVVAVDCKLTKEQCARLADVAHDGYARAIRPVHTQMDGDTVFSLATGKVSSDVNFIKLCAAAAEVMARAIANAVLFSLDA